MHAPRLRIHREVAGPHGLTVDRVQLEGEDRLQAWLRVGWLVGLGHTAAAAAFDVLDTPPAHTPFQEDP